jgi:hypothetical protein
MHVTNLIPFGVHFLTGGRCKLCRNTEGAKELNRRTDGAAGAGGCAGSGAGAGMGAGACAGAGAEAGAGAGVASGAVKSAQTPSGEATATPATLA